MGTRSAQEKSAEKIKLLRNPVVSAAFGHYFKRNWQTQLMLNELRAAGADIERLREWALCAFILWEQTKQKKAQTRPHDANQKWRSCTAAEENSVSASRCDIRSP